MKTEAKHELREQIEICDGCKSGAHGCEQFFCMCGCRHPTPWREGNTPAYSTIEDANGKTLLYDVISNKRPSEIRARVLRAVNNHDALVQALLMARPIVDDIANGRKTITRKQDAAYVVKKIDAALAAAQETK